MSAVLANQAWESLLTAHTRLLRGFAADDWDEVSMREYDVLYALAKAVGPVRIGDLAESVLLSQPGLSRLVDRLVHRGLLARCPDPVDGRAVRVSLTPAGIATQKRVGRRHARAVTRAMAGLTPSELEQLRTLTTRLTSRDTGNPVPTNHEGDHD